MKNITTKASIAFIVTMITILGSFGVASPVSAATSCNSRTITGVVDTGTPPARSRFEYATSYSAVVNGNSTKTTVRQFDTDGSFPVDEFITGLSGNTTYFYRLVVTNDFGTTYGEVEQFTTPACEHPAAVCEDPAATNYGGFLPCKYPTPKCQDIEATNYGGFLPCKYQQPTVTISLDKSTYCVYTDGSRENDRPRYTVRGSSNLANANIVWSSTQNGSPTGESNAFYGDTLNSSAMFSGYGESAWDVNDIGSWTKTAGITKNFGSILATSNTVSFKVKDCTPPAPKKCEDPAATNYGGSLPCKYPAPKKCEDPHATNYGGTLPCKYPQPKCEDPDAVNYGGSLPCKYPTPKCEDHNATNYGGSLPCKYPPAPKKCEDPYATNYGGTLPCKYPPAPQVCKDHKAENYGGELPCRYKEVKKPTVKLTVDDDELPYKGKTQLHWTVENATSCVASGGTNNWAGVKSIDGGTFNTGELTKGKIYTITCKNGYQSASDSVTIQVGEKTLSEPTLVISADKTTLNFEESTNVRWESSNTKSCTGEAGTNNWTGKRNTSGVFNTGKLSETTSYNITCEGTEGKIVTGSITIKVNNENEPSVTISADEENNLPFNTATNVRWDSENAKTCRMDGGNGSAWKNQKGLSGVFLTGKLKEDTTYNITCKNAAGKSASSSVTVHVIPENIENPTVDILADDETIESGQSTNVRWESQNATTCRTNGGSTGWTSSSKALSGIFSTGSLLKTTTFNITCENKAGKSASASVKVQVGGPLVEIVAEDPDISIGEATNVRWTSSNATKCTASAGSNGWAGRKGFSGIFNTGKLVKDTAFNITCENSTGASDSATVTIFVHGNEPIVTLTADKEKVPFGGKTVLRWESKNADTCRATAGTPNWISSGKALKGSTSTGALEEETTFTITCSNDAGDTDASYTVKVAGKINVTTL